MVPSRNRRVASIPHAVEGDAGVVAAEIGDAELLLEASLEWRHFLGRSPDIVNSQRCWPTWSSVGQKAIRVLLLETCLFSQVLAVADVWSSRWIVVSAGMTSDCSIE